MRARILFTLPIWAALGCETREGSHASNAAPSARPAGGAVVLAGRPKLARLPPRAAELAEPTVLLIPEDARAQIPIGGSRMGGLPDLPADAAWPSPRGRPLTFVAQLDMAEVARHLPDSEMPRR